MKPLYRSRGVRPEKSGSVSQPRLRHSLFLVPVHAGTSAQHNPVSALPSFWLYKEQQGNAIWNSRESASGETGTFTSL